MVDVPSMTKSTRTLKPGTSHKFRSRKPPSSWNVPLSSTLA